MPRKANSLNQHITSFIIALWCLFSGCQQGDDLLFNKLSPSASGINFTNELQYSDSLSVLEFEYMFNGSGVALLDANNDGLLDIFFGGNMVSSKLYLNRGKMQFEDVTKKAGVETNGWIYGISVVDINNDGYQDIYLCKAGSRRTRPADMKNVFFINNTDGTFTDKAAAMRVDDDGYDVHASFLDYDKDGDLDMYLLRNAFVNYNRNTAQQKNTEGNAPSTDKLFRNDGNMQFTDVSKAAGIIIEGFGLGATVCDLNNDNWPDIYVSNDFLTNDLVWMNNHDGTFTNKAGKLLGHQSYNGMGNDVADYNNDGLEDVMVVDMLPPDNKRWKLTMRGNTYEEFQNAISYGYEPQYVRNTLQFNNGDGTFSEIGQLAGVHATEWSWAPLFADFDNDGFKDLFVSNGYRQDITNLDFIRYGKNALFVGTPEANRKERLEQLKKYPGIKVHSYLFSNNKDLTFTDVSEEWGMTDPSYSNGAAYGDLDNDGDLDLVINKLDQVAAVYKNNSAGKSWLRVSFKGTTNNLQGIGSKIKLWQQGKMQTMYYSPFRGYLSTVEPFVHFGLLPGSVDSLEVVWPDGKSELLKNVQPARLLVLDHQNAKDSLVRSGLAKLSDSIFVKYDQIKYLHKEDPFTDFKIQPLVPKSFSHEGPGIAIADVNGDKLDDVLVGAGVGFSPALLLQQQNGSFLEKKTGIVNTADNMGALFFDADGDGDNDLYIASGGAAEKKSAIGFAHHFYVNDGKGNFSQNDSAIPAIQTSASGVSAADFDHDGDLDLFVAGRLRRGEYPLTPRSFLLRNDSKNGTVSFADVSAAVGDDLSTPGMVTTAIWTDFDNDGWDDLLMAGEYMPLRFYKNNKGIFKEITAATGLLNTSGWWNSLVSVDLDKDGDMDYVAGNLGKNSPLRASPAEPVCVYASDFDKDGRIDPVMCHYVDGEEHIVHSRDDITRQMTPMRARFRTYDSYADVSFRNAFTKSEVGNAKVFKSEVFESVYIENTGNGKFILKHLPLESQFAPIYGMISGDFNDDGNPDILCVGNSYSTEVQTGRYDAQGSLLLLGDGKGNVKPAKDYLNIRGDNKSLAFFAGSGKRQVFVIGSNSDSIKTFTTSRDQQQVVLDKDETVAILTNLDGSAYRQELQYGHSYLSQSSRTLFVPATVSRIEVITRAGKKRSLKF